MRLLWLLFAFLVVKSSGNKVSVKNQPSSSPQLTEHDYGTVSQDETAQNLDKCGAVITGLKAGDNGVIESPGYPQGYPSNADCEWSVKAQQGHLIQVTFFDVRTQKPDVPFGEAHDYLDVSLSGDVSETQRYSGDLNAITPFTLITDGPDLFLRFKSESSHDPGYTGFRIVYYVSNNTGVSALLPPKGAIAASCKYEPKDSPIAVELPNADDINLEDIPALSRKYDETLQKEFMELKEINRTNPHPYLVALVLDDEQFCSGTLIRNDYVVTTAHCASNVDKVDLVFGTDDISKDDTGVQRRTVSRSNIVTHPYFSESTGSNDIALIKLNEPIKTTRFVKAIRLPTWNTLGNVFSGHGVKVSGWGNSTEGNVFSKSRSKDLIISPNAACRASYFKGLNGMMMCSKQEPQATLCQADLGSPVTTKCAEDTKYYGRRKHRMHHLYSDVSSLHKHGARRRAMKNDERAPASGPGSAFAPPGAGAGAIPGSDGFKPPSNEISDTFNPGNQPGIPGQGQGSGFIPGVPGSCYRLINNPLSRQQETTSSPPVVNVYRPRKGKPQKPTASPSTTTTTKPMRPQKPAGKPNKPVSSKPKPEIEQATNNNNNMQSSNNNNNNRPNKPSASKPQKPATDNNNNRPPNTKPNKPVNPPSEPIANRPPGRPSKPGSISQGQGQGQRPNRPTQGQRPNKPTQGHRPNRPTQGQGKPPNQPNQSGGGGGISQSNGIGGCSGFQRSNNVLLGMVSFGSCQKGFVFTRITAYMDFLQDNMNYW